MLEVCGLIESHKKQVAIMKKVHAEVYEVVNVCNALKRTLNQASTTLSVFSNLPGIGRQLRSLYKMDSVKFLLGPDCQDMSSEILLGSQESAKFCFAASGKTLSAWKARHAENRKRNGHSKQRDHEDKKPRGNFGGKPKFSGKN